METSSGRFTNLDVSMTPCTYLVHRGQQSKEIYIMDKGHNPVKNSSRGVHYL